MNFDDFLYERLQNQDVKKEYDTLETEYSLIRTRLDARKSMKTWFVYDKETGYILSSLHTCDNLDDGYNPFTRPYKYDDYCKYNETCKLDYIYNMSIKEGLTSLKKENMIVTTTDKTNPDSEFIENENFFYDTHSCQGWWKLKSYIIKFNK